MLYYTIDVEEYDSFDWPHLRRKQYYQVLQMRGTNNVDKLWPFAKYINMVFHSTHDINHTQGFITNGSFQPTSYGIYQLQRVTEDNTDVRYKSFGSVEVSQSDLDAWNNR